MTMTEPVRRSREIEDFSKRYVIAPLIDWVVPVFAKIGVTPNMVSVGGLLAGVIAALFLQYYAVSWQYSIAGLVMLLVWHVFDGADGRLARLTNRQSEFGKVVDGICDYVVFISIYVVLSLQLMPIYGSGIWFLMVAAGIMHAIQAGAYELQRQEFEFWGRGKKSAELPDLNNTKPLGDKATAWQKFAHALGLGYARMQYRSSGIGNSDLRPSLYAYVEGLDEQALQNFRDRYRALNAKQVLQWGIMCPHYRSFIIVASCLLKRPEIYLIIEAFVLPLVHIYLVRMQNTFNASLLDRLKKTGDVA